MIAPPQSRLSVPDVAKLLRVDPASVRTWIATGELVGIDVSRRRGGRPRWRIDRADLADFERRRQAIAPPPKPRPRRKRLQEVIKFF